MPSSSVETVLRDKKQTNLINETGSQLTAHSSLSIFFNNLMACCKRTEVLFHLFKIEISQNYGFMLVAIS